MESASAGRISLIGWANLILGLSAPIRIAGYSWMGLRVFSVDWAASALIMMGIVELILGGLVAHCGWILLKRRPTAIRETWGTAGALLGYLGCGILTMIQHESRSFDIVIRHGYESLLGWSLSHFQAPLIFELLQSLWWMFVLWSICFQAPRELSSSDRSNISRFGLFGIAVFAGLILRAMQIASDLSLSINR